MGSSLLFVSGNYQKKRLTKSPANPGDTDCVLAAFPRLEVKKEGVKKQKSCARLGSGCLCASWFRQEPGGKLLRLAQKAMVGDTRYTFLRTHVDSPQNNKTHAKEHLKTFFFVWKA